MLAFSENAITNATEGSGGPLPAEWHHQNLVFPSNYTLCTGPPAPQTFPQVTAHVACRPNPSKATNCAQTVPCGADRHCGARRSLPMHCVHCPAVRSDSVPALHPGRPKKCPAREALTSNPVRKCRMPSSARSGSWLRLRQFPLTISDERV